MDQQKALWKHEQHKQENPLVTEERKKKHHLQDAGDGF